MTYFFGPFQQLHYFYRIGEKHERAFKNVSLTIYWGSEKLGIYEAQYIIDLTFVLDVTLSF